MNNVETLTALPAQTPSRPLSARPELIRRMVNKGAVVVGTLVACVVLLEVGLRAIGRYQVDNTQGYFEQGGISFVLKKNVNKRVVWPTMSFTVCTSDEGFRAIKPGPAGVGQRPYYVVLGASDAFGNGLDYPETFVGILADKLNRHGIDVVNLAIAGHHLQEQTALFRTFVQSKSRPPEAVLIVYNPLFIGGYDDNHPNVIVRRGDLFDKDNWKIALLRKTLGNTSAAYCYFRDGVRHFQQRFLAREDVSLSFYLERFSKDHRIHNPAKAEDFLKYVKELEQFIRSLGAKPISIYCPPSGIFMVNDLVAKGKLDAELIDTKIFPDLIASHCQADGVDFIDLTPPVQARFDKGEKLNFDLDGHFNGPTSRIVGDYLYEALRPDRATAGK
jgi:hypothetical protein